MNNMCISCVMKNTTCHEQGVTPISPPITPMSPVTNQSQNGARYSRRGGSKPKKRQRRGTFLAEWRHALVGTEGQQRHVQRWPPAHMQHPFLCPGAVPFVRCYSLQFAAT